MKMEQTQCSETSAYKIQTPGNHPEESIQHDTCCKTCMQCMVKASLLHAFGFSTSIVNKNDDNCSM